MTDITISTEKTKATYDIRLSSKGFSAIIKPYLLALHAWTGCDTTSAIHMKGKTSLIKKIETSLAVRKLLDVIRDPNSDQHEVGTAGVKLFLQMYGGTKSLARLRYFLNVLYQMSNPPYNDFLVEKKS